MMSFELDGWQRIHRPYRGNECNEKSEKRLDEPCASNGQHTGDCNDPFALGHG